MSVRSWIADRWLAEYWRPLTLGERGERVAVRTLRRRGYRIAATRRRIRYGEIDVIAVDGRTIVFVEVKTRRSERLGSPATAVDHLRRRRMTRAAVAFLKAHDLLSYPARFDVVEVVWPTDADEPLVRHHVNAFPAEGRAEMLR